jgi:hypothetical protein
VENPIEEWQWTINGRIRPFDFSGRRRGKVAGLAASKTRGEAVIFVILCGKILPICAHGWV